MTPVVAANDGWHWREWTAEFTGTAILLFAVVTAKYWAVRAGPPYSNFVPRVSIVSAVAAAAVIAVAYSPLGRRSGAHLNPAVTLGLWAQGITGVADLIGYTVAQLAGGVVGVAAARSWGSAVAAATVHWAVIAPAAQIPATIAALIEAAATFVQLAAVFLVLNSQRLRAWTPVVAGLLLGAFIIALAPMSGAGFNPVRGLAPDVLANAYPAIWIYLTGPLGGAVLAGLLLLRRGHRPPTGKLRHDPHIACHMRCALPHST